MWLTIETSPKLSYHFRTLQSFEKIVWLFERTEVEILYIFINLKSRTKNWWWKNCQDRNLPELNGLTIFLNFIRKELEDWLFFGSSSVELVSSFRLMSKKFTQQLGTFKFQVNITLWSILSSREKRLSARLKINAFFLRSFKIWIH